MNNHIYRHGLMPKKTGDGRSHIYFHTKKPGPRPAYDYNSTKLFGHLPATGWCGFRHAPYNSQLEVKDPKVDESGFHVATTVGLIERASTLCDFCHVLWLGLVRYRTTWEYRCGLYNYRDALVDRVHELTEELYYSLLYDYGEKDKFLETHPVDLSMIVFKLTSKRECQPIEVRLLLEPKENSTYARMRELVHLEFHTVPGKPSEWTAFAPAPQVCADVLDDECIQRISGWIDECVEKHAPCNATTKKVLPARLLRVERPLNSAEPSVCLHVVDPALEYKFVALSHVWANSTPLKTTLQNLDELLKSVPWGDLPEVFQNTVRLTLSLGLEFIWIDSLCIIQGDEADWLAESPKMGAIYGNAHVVFAAHGGDLGFCKDIVACSEEKGEEGASALTKGDANVFARCAIDHSVLINPADNSDTYFGRAWCFQERLFASRILHFGGSREEVFFECNVHLRCECEGVQGLVKSEQNSASSANYHYKSGFSDTLQQAAAMEPGEAKENVWQLYMSLCETFSSQGLSHPEDTLPALLSLVDRIGPYLGGYYAGLWEYNILLGLQWESLSGQGSNRHASYVAPSFSWASRTGPVVWYIADEYLKDEPGKVKYAVVLDISCDTSPGAPHSRVTGGYIKIRGYAVTMQFEDIAGCYSQGRLKILPLAKWSTTGETSMQLTENEATGSQNDTPPDTPPPPPEKPSKKKWTSKLKQLIKPSRQPTTDSKHKPRSSRVNDVEDLESYVCMDAIEDMLEARGKTVLCLDIMRDMEETNRFISALILWPVDARPGSYRRIGYSTMTEACFDKVELMDVTII